MPYYANGQKDGQLKLKQHECRCGEQSVALLLVGSILPRHFAYTSPTPTRWLALARHGENWIHKNHTCWQLWNVNELSFAIRRWSQFAAAQITTATISCTQYWLMSEATLGFGFIPTAEFAPKLGCIFKWPRHEDVDGWTFGWWSIAYESFEGSTASSDLHSTHNKIQIILWWYLNYQLISKVVKTLLTKSMVSHTVENLPCARLFAHGRSRWRLIILA